MSNYVTVQDHSNRPPNKWDLPSAKCDHCGRPKDRHTMDEVYKCKTSKYADAGQSAGTRHSRK